MFLLPRWSFFCLPDARQKDKETGHTASKCLNVNRKSLKNGTGHVAGVPVHTVIKPFQWHFRRFGLKPTVRLLPPVINLPVSGNAGGGGGGDTAVPVGAAAESQRSILVVLKGLKL